MEHIAHLAACSRPPAGSRRASRGALIYETLVSNSNKRQQSRNHVHNVWDVLCDMMWDCFEYAMAYCRAILTVKHYKPKPIAIDKTRWKILTNLTIFSIAARNLHYRMHLPHAFSTLSRRFLSAQVIFPVMYTVWTIVQVGLFLISTSINIFKSAWAFSERMSSQCNVMTPLCHTNANEGRQPKGKPPETQSTHQGSRNLIWKLRELRRIHYSDVIMGAMVSQMTNLTIVYSIVYCETPLQGRARGEIP